MGHEFSSHLIYEYFARGDELLLQTVCNPRVMYLRVRSLRGGYRRRVGMEVYMAVERKGLNITNGIFTPGGTGQLARRQLLAAQ